MRSVISSVFLELNFRDRPGERGLLLNPVVFHWSCSGDILGVALAGGISPTRERRRFLQLSAATPGEDDVTS